MWLCELVLYPASLCSLVVGCQYITKSFRNSVQLEINTIPAHIIWGSFTLLVLDNVVWVMIRSVLVWGFILTTLPAICYSLPSFVWMLLLPWYAAMFLCFCKVFGVDISKSAPKKIFFCGEIQTFMSENCFSLSTNKTASSRDRTKLQFRFIVIFVYFIWVCSSNANFVFGKCALNLVESCHIMHRMEQTWVFIHL